MSTVQLRRIDPSRNMARFYMLTVQPSLFGEWCLVREWGRIGSPGRVASTPFPSLPWPRRPWTSASARRSARDTPSPSKYLETKRAPAGAGALPV
ncbi:WGR domain-containing protein (plasmid) [Xanthobacter dioxanivorans]|uniref:WGR domain-containing protein n=1 Tax=Xanthobacter dioxanivorans TaxID=2528964 RepID=A0A974PV25_9HYPH|nr:WGR domain-containing protein [Xanthobacter dioxanivorans]